MNKWPLVATGVVWLLLFATGGVLFDGFLSLRVFFNLLSDNAFLGVIAVGLTFVILSGGIDLSVGSMVGCTGILTAVLIQAHGWHPLAAIFAALAFGLAIGASQGGLIQRFGLPPFLVTLAGLFFLRGVSLWISRESVRIDHSLFADMAAFSVKLPGKASLSLGALAFLAVLIGGIAVARHTVFGRTVFAIGGSESSAVLMGLAVPRTKVGVYALSGVLSAFGGVLYALYTSSGNAISGTGMELDAIAAVVIGGTLLSGGVGSVFGSFVGVLILGTAQTLISFQGTLSSWWTKIFIGALLLAFIVLQKVLERTSRVSRLRSSE